MKLVGEIDGIDLFYDVNLKASQSVISFSNNEYMGFKIKPCNCEICIKYPTAIAAGKKYSDIKYIVKGTESIEAFEKKLKNYKKYLENE